MTKKKLINRDELLKYKVGVRFDEKTYNQLKSWVEQTNTATVGELVRKIVTNEKVTFYTRDISMKEPTDELIRIRKEINAIGVNINQITEFFHTADSPQQKLFHALKVADNYQQVTEQVYLIWKQVTEMSNRWSAR
jgi:hypothetical protein